MDKEMQDYAAQDDLRTIVKAHAIKSDPKRMAAAKAHHAMQLAAMKKIGSPLGQPTVEGKEKGPPDAEDRAEARAKKK